MSSCNSQAIAMSYITVHGLSLSLSLSLSLMARNAYVLLPVLAWGNEKLGITVRVTYPNTFVTIGDGV
jgi:hypothetical protein